MANGPGSAGKGHEFLRAISKFTQEQGKTSSANKAIRLGLVDYAYDPQDFLGGINPRILFDGESVVSQKRYTVMPPYYPIPGQRVCLIPVGTTYLIIGAVVNVPQDPKVDIFTSTDIWEKPAGARMIRIQVQGGGGAGGGAPATPTGNTSGGAGGGGGGYGESWISANGVDPSVTVTVGTGGAGVAGAAGGAGVASSFGSFVSAAGGFAGSLSTANTIPGLLNGASGGSIITADIVVTGSGGGAGGRLGTTGGLGGTGGASCLGGGARGTGSSSGSVAGQDGTIYGGGGGGASASPNTGGTTAVLAGGNGADGVVIVTTYF
jgi:hypothetical protein